MTRLLAVSTTLFSTPPALPSLEASVRRRSPKCGTVSLQQSAHRHAACPAPVRCNRTGHTLYILTDRQTDAVALRVQGSPNLLQVAVALHLIFDRRGLHKERVQPLALLDTVHSLLVVPHEDAGSCLGHHHVHPLVGRIVGILQSVETDCQLRVQSDCQCRHSCDCQLRVQSDCQCRHSCDCQLRVQSDCQCRHSCDCQLRVQSDCKYRHSCIYTATIPEHYLDSHNA